MVRTAIQLYSLREMDESLPALLRRVGDTDFDGVELAGLGDADPEVVADALDDAGLDVAAAHVPFEELTADPAAVVATYRELGCETLVVPYLDASYFESEKRAVETARRLDALAEEVEAAGATLCYHNHDHEFVDLGDRTAFDAFLSASDLAIELDLGWVVAADRDPRELLDRLAGRTPLVHVKDTDAGTPVELGDGELSVEACARSARDAGADWLVYEHDDAADPEASLAHGARRLAALR